MKQESTKIASIIKKELLQDPTVDVQFEIEQPANDQQFYKLVTTINKEKIETYIFIGAQKNTLYYFPKLVFKKIVTELATIFKKITHKEIKIEEAPCNKCPHILKCKLNCPTRALLEQIGANTKSNCLLFSQKINRDFIDSATKSFSTKK